MELDIGKMEEQLDVWDAKIEQLAAEALRVPGQSGLDLHYRVDDLKARRALARARVAQFRAAGDEKHEESNASLQVAWDDLKAALKNLGLQP